MLSEDTWGDLRVQLDQLEDWVLVDVWAGSSEVHEGLETWVWLPEHTVAVTWDDTTALEGAPQVVLDVLLGWVRWDCILHLQNPSEHFLGSQTVEWTSETLQAGRVRKEGV